MKAVIIGVGTIAVLGGAMIFSNQPSQENGQQSSVSSQYSQIQADIKDSSAKLYDVRTAEEYRAGHLDEAVNLSLQDIEAGKLPEASKDSKIYLYCRSGNRSSQAKAILENAGFSNVVDLGGLSDVQAMGGKLVAS